MKVLIPQNTVKKPITFKGGFDMKKILLTSAVFAITAFSFGEEKEVNVVSSVPIEIYGGVSGGYFWTNNTVNSSDKDDRIQLSNGIIGFKGGLEGNISLKFDLAIGTLLIPSLWDGGQGNPLSYEFSSGFVSSDGFGIAWGYTSLEPVKGISVDAGVLTTNLGYEVANTYVNPNITLGVVWYAQPVIYEGIRANLYLNELVGIPFSFYIEYNQEFNGDNFAAGTSINILNTDVAINYFDYTNRNDGLDKNLIDIVFNLSVPFAQIGVNFDYHWWDDKTKKNFKNENKDYDDSAWGLALYVVPELSLAKGKLTFLIRFEYFDEGKSGIYSGAVGTDNNGWSFTITPTYKPAENTFIRFEYAYLSTDKKVINNTDDNKTTVAIEFVFTF